MKKLAISAQPFNIDPSASLNNMWDEFYAYIDGDDTVGEIEIDLSDIHYVDSMGLNLFICVYKMALGKKTPLTFLNVTPDLMKVFSFYAMNDPKIFPNLTIIT